jgi:hypothetical protein
MCDAIAVVKLTGITTHGGITTAMDTDERLESWHEITRCLHTIITLSTLLIVNRQFTIDLRVLVYASIAANWLLIVWITLKHWKYVNGSMLNLGLYDRMLKPVASLPVNTSLFV